MNEKQVRSNFGTKWCSDVPGTRIFRDGDTGNEDDVSKLVSNAAFAHAPVCSKTRARMQE